MTRHGMTSRVALPAALALLFLAASAALPQEEPGKSNPAEGKKAEEKKTAPKRVEVRFKVSVEDGGELPPSTRVEISGQEQACGSLNANDVSSAVDENGQAVFKSLPVRKIAVKINANLFLPLRIAIDLAGYKSPVALTLEREK